MEVVQLLGCRVLAAPGAQWGWWLGQQEIQCSRRVWRPVLAHTPQYSCLENPPDGEAWQATVYRSQRVAHYQSDPTRIDARLFSCGSSAPVRVECEGGSAI